MSAAGSEDATTPEVLREEIEHTRQQLGDTVEALVAKADVKARAQRKASETVQRVKQKAAVVKVDAVGRLKPQTGSLRHQTVTRPQSVQQALSGAGRYRTVAIAGVAAALLVTWLLVRRPWQSAD
jgi:Protein of unknown function (DUF3618)